MPTQIKVEKQELPNRGSLTDGDWVLEFSIIRVHV